MTTARDTIGQVKARCEAATMGEWEHDGDGTIKCSGMMIATTECYEQELTGMTEVDAEFIAHARKDLPDVVAFTEAILDRAEQWATVRDTARAATFRRVSATILTLAEQHLGGGA